MLALLHQDGGLQAVPAGLLRLAGQLEQQGPFVARLRMLGKSLDHGVAVLEQGGQTIEIDATQAVIELGLALPWFRWSAAAAEGEPEQARPQGWR